MTKRELIDQLAAVTDDATVTLVSHDGTVNDVKDLAWALPIEGWLKHPEIYLYPTAGRQ